MSKMKIAIIGSALYQAPTEKGIIHAPIYLTTQLADGLSRLGHKITFFGLFDPKLKKNVNFRTENLGYTLFDKKKNNLEMNFFVTYEQGFMAKVLARVSEFDLIYSHIYKIGPLARLVQKPVVITHHDATRLKMYQMMFQSFGSPNFFVIPLSKFIKKKLPYFNYLDVVYNGIDDSKINFSPKPENYFVWVGRVVPPKGLHLAIALAKKMKFKLKIAGPMEEFGGFGDTKNYLQEIKKEIKKNSNIEYLGVLSREKTYRLLEKARALIFPSEGIEACPLVPLEAMIAGTPVITTPLGPLPELVKDGVSGFLCKNQKTMEQAILKINSISREKCRGYALKKFTANVMAKNYEKQFQKALIKFQQRSKNAKN